VSASGEYWPPSVSVVVPTHNEGARLHETVANLLRTLPHLSEVVVVDDGSVDGSADALVGVHPQVFVHRPPFRLGVAKARNYGAMTSRGDMLVFCDAHLDITPYWVEYFTESLAIPRVGMIGPAVQDLTDPDGAVGYGLSVDERTLDNDWLPPPPNRCAAVPALGGMFTALRRSTFFEVGMFDSGLDLWGYEDIELSIRLWLLGYEVLVDQAVRARHLFRTSFPYPVDETVILANRLRVAFTHYEGERLAFLVDRARGSPRFSAALSHVVGSDVWTWRDRLHSVRQHDADWLAIRFAPAAATAGPG
jgi:glycosyltransferase involved in cell wall biosynthesis